MGICHWDRGLITAPETPEKIPEVLRKQTDQQVKDDFTMKYTVYSSDLLEIKQCRI